LEVRALWTASAAEVVYPSVSQNAEGRLDCCDVFTVRWVAASKRNR